MINSFELRIIAGTFPIGMKSHSPAFPLPICVGHPYSPDMLPSFLCGPRWSLIAAGFFGFAAVALGTVGSHVLHPRLSPENYERFSTALSYHWLHTLALFALGLVLPAQKRECQLPFSVAAVMFSFGIVLFSGSLYCHALTGVILPLAPFGGVLLMLGWLSIIWLGFMLRSSTD